MDKEKVKEILIKRNFDQYKFEKELDIVAEEIDDLYKQPEQSLREKIKKIISGCPTYVAVNEILSAIREEIEKQPYDACRKITILELLK